MTMRTSIKVISLLLLVVLAACSEESQDSTRNINPVTVETVLKSDVVRYTRGLKLYQQTCAACHGRHGEGAPNWQKKDAEGKFLPPPLNGTGHTWHHSMQMLVDIIDNGTQRLGGNMPPWKGKLTDAQIQDILFWIQSQWSRELYSAWFRNNQEILSHQAISR